MAHYFGVRKLSLHVITVGNAFDGTYSVETILEGESRVPLPELLKVFITKFTSDLGDRADFTSQGWDRRYQLALAELCKKYGVEYNTSKNLTQCFIRYLTTELGFTEVHFSECHTED
jgi:hypothetical protein